MILSRKIRFLVLAGFAVLAVIAFAMGYRHGQNAIVLVPHQAIYSLRLSRLRQANSIAAVSGQMFYRMDSSCEGYTVDQRFNMQFIYAEGPTALMSSSFNTWESRDGRKYSFATRRMRDGEVTDDIRGKATRDGTNGQIYYQLPMTQAVPLPAGAQFPMQHTLAILKAAKAGQKWFQGPLFDGSDLSPVTDVSVFMRPAAKPYVAIENVESVKDTAAVNDDVAAEITDTVSSPMTADELNNSPLLKNSKAWRVQMAFYAAPPLKTDNGKADDNDPAIAPDYEMTMVLHDNGVISSFIIDYPEFSLDSHLLGLKELAKNGC